VKRNTNFDAQKITQQYSLGTKEYSLITSVVSSGNLLMYNSQQSSSRNRFGMGFLRNCRSRSA